MPAARANEQRTRNHPAWWAFWVHRVSGLALALFLPVHFWMLGSALRGAAALDARLRLVDLPLAKFAEWGLVLLLAAHLAGGLRLLLVEFGPAKAADPLRKDALALAAGFAAAAGLAFALALLG
jgi:fumarate reductase subunit D